jgi:hypothetical protein
MWKREVGMPAGQACSASGDFFTEPQRFIDKIILENQFPYTKKFTLR